MSSDPPPPYPGGPSAPVLEEKNKHPPVSVTQLYPSSTAAHPYPDRGEPYLTHGLTAGPAPVMTGPPHGQPLPPEYGPPPYEATMQPGFIPPHVPGEGPMPMPDPHGGYYPHPGHYPHPMPGQFGPGPSHFAPPVGHTATVIGPPGTATTVTVLQGELFQSAPVQTVCPHCQQTIVTRISHDVGLMNTLFCLFCFFVGCDLGCCLIPCLIDDLKDVTHTCPNCKGYIYTYKRIC